MTRSEILALTTRADLLEERPVPEEYLRIGELEERLRVSSWKIKQLRREAGLPYVKWGAGTVRYPWQKIQEWMEEYEYVG